MRHFLFWLACSLLVLVGCQPVTAPGGPTAQTAPTQEVVASEEITQTEGMIETEEVTSTAEMPTTQEGTAQVSVPAELVQLILDFAPGAWTPIHEHGGPMVVTVLEGEITTRSEGTGEETVYAPGEFWTEVPGQVHAAGNDTEENVRVAVTVVLPEGAQLTMAHEGETEGDLPPGPTVVFRTSMPVTVEAR